MLLITLDLLKIVKELPTAPMQLFSGDERVKLKYLYKLRYDGMTLQFVRFLCGELPLFGLTIIPPCHRKGPEFSSRCWHYCLIPNNS